MAPDTILVEDALSLSLLVAERKQFRRIGPIGFRIISCKKRIGFRGFGVLPTAEQAAESCGHECGEGQLVGSHRPAPCPIACELSRAAVFCGLIPACRVIK